MISKIQAFTEKHYSLLASILISAYFLCALEVSTMIHYLPLIPTLVKLLRYVLYLCFVILWAFGFSAQNRVTSFGDFIHRLLLWLVNHLMFCFAGLTAVLIFISSGSLIPAALLLMVLVIQYADLKQILKWILVTQSAACLLLIGLSLAGVIENLTYPAFLRGVRYSLGYIFPLELHAHFLMISLLYLYLFPKQHGWKSLLLISVLNFGLYQFTIARTSFLLTEAAAVLSFVCGVLPYSVKEKITGWKHWKTVVPILTAIVFVSFIVVCLMYNPKVLLWERIDDALSGRLRLGRSALETYPITLFGQRIEWVGTGGPEGVYVWENTYNFVDNAYIKDLMDNGLVFWVLEILAFIWLQLKFLKKNNLMAFLIVWVFFGLGMMEPRLILLPFGFLLLFFSQAALSSNVQVEAWFRNEFSIAGSFRRAPVWLKAGTLGVLVIALSLGFIQLREFRINTERKRFASDLLTHRAQYAYDLWMSSAGTDIDPFELRDTLFDAVEDTKGYEQTVYDVLGSNTSSAMTVEQFESVSELDEQKIERIYQQITEAGDELSEEELQNIKAELQSAYEELDSEQNQ